MNPSTGILEGEEYKHAVNLQDHTEGRMQDGRHQDGRPVENHEANTNNSQLEKTKMETHCGFGPCSPNCLQPCAVPGCFLFCICVLVLVQSFVVSGYSSSILTTIEKRYQLWSSELGFIISSYDITAVLAGIIVSYFGDTHNRARWLSRGAMLIAVGAIVFSLPHFLGHPPSNNNSTVTDVGICNHSMAESALNCEDGQEALKNPETWALAVFIVAFMLIGIGASPVYTLGPTYLYDNMRLDHFPLYSGIMYSMGALGPAAGFLVGAALLQLYVVPGEAPDGLQPSSPTWVGAWWIGFLMTAFMAVAVAIPLTFFPRELPEAASHTNSEDRPAFASFGSRLKDFPKYFRKLLRNLTWLTITLTIVAEQSIGTGFNRFIAKYMQLSFNLPPSSANLFTGCVLIPAAVLGIISGGGVMNKLKPSMTGTVKLLMLLNCFPTILLATLFALGCDSINIVGITDAYIQRPEPIEQVSVSYKWNLTADCNAQCQCKEAVYSPVCGSNLRTYYNPCYAGCTRLHVHTEPDGSLIKNYSSCACVYDEFIHTQAANTGRCDAGCRNLVPFLVILFIVVFLTTCGHNPAIIITLRSVNPNTRSFALGMQNFFSQVLAFIPAPIYFGQIFDSQCILWTPRCDGTGSCLEYDTHRLPYVLFGTCLGLKVLVFFFLFLTWLAARRSEKSKDTYDLDVTSNTNTTDTSVPSRSTSVSTISVSWSHDTSSRDTTVT